MMCMHVCVLTYICPESLFHDTFAFIILFLNVMSYFFSVLHLAFTIISTCEPV